MISDYLQCSICRGGRGFNPPLVPLNPQVFIDPHWLSQEVIADWLNHKSSTDYLN